MPLGSPSIILSSSIKGVTKSPKFAELSPASQAALLRLASQPPGSTLREFQENNAAYKDAFAEAKQKGLISDTPLWKEILKGVAITGGAALAGPLLGAAFGPGAGASGGVGLGETGATTGIGTTLSGGSALGGGIGVGETAASTGLTGASALGSTAGTVAGSGISGGAATGANTLWSKLASPLATTGILAGTNLLGTKMQVDAQKQAAEIAAAQAEKALEWEKAVYGQRQAQLAPAIGVGQGATLKLGDLMGIKAPEGGYQPPPMPGSSVAPAAPAAAVPAAPAAPAQEPTVQMKAPTGQISAVPQSQVAHYTSMGATVVQ